jgi:lipoate-protein ligase A
MRYRHPVSTAAGAAWRTLPLHVGSAAEQLALTETLWRVVAGGAGPTLRWYTYASPALVLGVSQQQSAVDQVACAAAGVDVVRRSTGGVTVYASRGMLALDAALPASHPLAVADVVEAYRWLGEACLSAVRALSPQQAERLVLVSLEEARLDQQAARVGPLDTPRHLRTLACFGTLSPYEVAVRREDGSLAKLVGLSQLRKRGVVLFQAGLYTSPSNAHLTRLLPLSDQQAEALAAKLDRRVAGLNEIGLGGTDWPALIAAVERVVLPEDEASQTR